jgi:hypothetical protein
MKLRPGVRVQSQVCDTQAIVIQAAAGDTDLRCGGAPIVVDRDAHLCHSGTPLPGFDGGSQLGKRYVIPVPSPVLSTADAPTAIEVLVVSAGAGTLSVGDQLMEIKAPKPLPASD